ncbi:uncharacterized protein LOC122503006 [Leptopilina heterotoma]|uniref:uncharacterized protein LOC122503006 n=1 Tax=Leptopilina heterotoma TaxID=63436 RepID=UPI001CAA379B|nr:uncharacterized protein LOC122503006 [Leptopilina heterotoma]
MEWILKNFMNKNPLKQALQFGSIEEIQNVLCEKYQATLLIETDWSEKCRQIINICLDKKLDVNIEDTNYCALLHFVIKHLAEDFESVINKCEEFDINALNDVPSFFEPEYKKSLLHLAIDERKLNVVKILIEFGANVDIKDEREQTALFYAVQTKQIEVAEMLLKAGASVNAKDCKNMMPINFAFGERDESSGNEKYKPSKLVTLLCSYGAELDFKNQSGTRTLIMACGIGNAKEIEFLIEHGADLLSSDKDGKTALHSAAVKYNYKLVDFLIRRGFDINAQNLEKESSIHYLANTLKTINSELEYAGDNTHEDISNIGNLDSEGDEVKKAAEMIEFLADNSADINTPNKENITPLMISIRYNALEITECLLELNAKIHKNDNFLYYDCSCPQINTEFHSDKITTWVLLIAFIVLKEIAVHENIFTSDDFNWVDYSFQSCVEEVAYMQEKKIWPDLKVTFYDFLNEDLLKVTKYFRNDDVMSVLEYEKYQEFPDYKYLFEKRIERVQKIKNCLNVFLCFLEEFFEGNLPILAFDIIINYLTAGNLRNFGRALCITEESPNGKYFVVHEKNLIQALMFGSIVEIENILCEKYQATFSSENDSVEKCRQIINICLEKKIDINFERRKYNALLHFVIKHLDEDFKSVINKCEDFDVNGLMHSTAMSLLHLAIEGKKQNVVQILIEFGADVDVKDGCQKTPLFYAVESKQIEIAEMLLKAGANVNAKDHEDMMPINFAFGERDETSGNEKYKPSKLVKLLCSYGADLNFKNENGNMTLLSVCKNGNFKEIEFLIARGADLFSTDVDDKTALHYAALGFNYNLVDFLLRSGFDMNDKYLFNGSLVHTLANFSRDIYMVLNLLAGDRNTNNVLSEAHYNDIKESANMVEFLADNGADINTFMHERYTPLLSSVQSNYLEITECLLELKAKIHKKLFKSYYYCSYPNIHVNPKLFLNKIIMQSAVLKVFRDNVKHGLLFTDENKGKIEIILQYGSNVEIEENFCEQYHATFSSDNNWSQKCRQIINICLEKKIDVNVESTKYCALLHFVIKHLDEDFEPVVKKCEGFDINALNDLPSVFGPKDKKSLLHLAIDERKQNVVKALIEFGADVDVKDGCQKTPLFYAVESKQIEIAEMLLKAKANVNAKDHDDMMPINFAFGERVETSVNEKYKPSKMVTLLCSYGAELDFKNQSGTLTLLMACRKGNFREIEFLVEHGADLFSGDINGTKALHYAALGNNYNIVDFLLRKGFDINAKDLSDQSSVHKLAIFLDEMYDLFDIIEVDRTMKDILNENHDKEMKESANMVEFLADNGADINIFMREQYTPLVLCVEGNYLEITECLLELNAKIYRDLYKWYYFCSFPNYHVNTKFHFNKITTWVLLTAFLALKNIDIENCGFLPTPNFEWVYSFFEECEQEVMKMRDRRIWADREVSFYDFLNEDLLKVTKYFRNDDVMSILESDKYDEFPNYKYLFEKRIERVVKIKNCQYVFIRFLKEFFKENLPSVVIYQIINYLTAGDLRNFGRAFCITEETPNGKYFIVYEKK